MMPRFDTRGPEFLLSLRRRDFFNRQQSEDEHVEREEASGRRAARGRRDRHAGESGIGGADRCAANGRAERAGACPLGRTLGPWWLLGLWRRRRLRRWRDHRRSARSPVLLRARLRVLRRPLLLWGRPVLLRSRPVLSGTGTGLRSCAGVRPSAGVL